MSLGGSSSAVEDAAVDAAVELVSPLSCESLLCKLGSVLCIPMLVLAGECAMHSNVGACRGVCYAFQCWCLQGSVLCIPMLVLAGECACAP